MQNKTLTRRRRQIVIDSGIACPYCSCRYGHRRRGHETVNGAQAQRMICAACFHEFITIRQR